MFTRGEILITKDRHDSRGVRREPVKLRLLWAAKCALTLACGRRFKGAT